jgi:hypothetical protein
MTLLHCEVYTALIRGKTTDETSEETRSSPEMLARYCPPAATFGPAWDNSHKADMTSTLETQKMKMSSFRQDFPYYFGSPVFVL